MKQLASIIEVIIIFQSMIFVHAEENEVDINIKNAVQTIVKNNNTNVVYVTIALPVANIPNSPRINIEDITSEGEMLKAYVSWSNLRNENLGDKIYIASKERYEDGSYSDYSGINGAINIEITGLYGSVVIT